MVFRLEVLLTMQQKWNPRILFSQLAFLNNSEKKAKNQVGCGNNNSEANAERVLRTLQQQEAEVGYLTKRSKECLKLKNAVPTLLRDKVNGVTIMKEVRLRMQQHRVPVFKATIFLTSLITPMLSQKS